MKFFDLFEHFYIINLPERTDRKRHMEKELEKIGIPFECDKVSLFKAIKPENQYPFKSIGIKGVFMSHLSILKDARKLGLKNFLILEDDAEFSRAFMESEVAIIKQLEDLQWDIVQFGYCAMRKPILTEGMVKSQDDRKNFLIPFSGEITGAHCCAINGKTVDKLIDFLEGLINGPSGDRAKGPMPIDGAYNVFSWRSETNRFIAHPSLVSQISSRSDITPSRFDKNPMLRPILSIIRSLGLTRYFRVKRNREI
ncbi:MAG: glycosyltransferase family 25 protein [Leptolyngbya sp. SIO3F4]|nr:glycosyltransferase family 25 protein [Leptolyngbya sp. SIO3F4]